MSSVRMCDRCGTIFSENDDGWSSANGAVQRRRENGTRYTEQVTKDMCADCTNGATAPGPRLPAPAAAITAADSPASATAAAEADLDHFRLAELERQVTELRYPGATLDAPPGTATANPVTIIGQAEQ